MVTFYITMLTINELIHKIDIYKKLLYTVVNNYNRFYKTVYEENVQISRENYEFLIETYNDKYSLLLSNLEKFKEQMQMLTENDKELLRLYKTLCEIILQCLEVFTKTKAFLNAAYNKSYVSSLQGSIIRQQSAALNESVSGSPEMQELVETIKDNSKNIYLYRGGKLRKTRYRRHRQSKRQRQRQSRRYRR